MVEVVEGLQSFELLGPDAGPAPPLVENPDESEDPFGPGLMDPGTEPDLYPPLTPVTVLAATAPSADEILQQQRKRLSQSSVARPPPAAPLLYREKEHGAGLLDECREEALRRSQLQLLQAVPGICRPNQTPEFDTYPVMW